MVLGLRKLVAEIRRQLVLEFIETTMTRLAYQRRSSMPTVAELLGVGICVTRMVRGNLLFDHPLQVRSLSLYVLSVIRTWLRHPAFLPPLKCGEEGLGFLQQRMEKLPSSLGHLAPVVGGIGVGGNVTSMFVDEEDLSEPHRQQPLDMVDVEDQFMEEIARMRFKRLTPPNNGKDPKKSKA
ncbi:hypothetical protein TIFTF001_023226 [Ficus carica]|uniref:Uncharacterized protein n=1 Tax=Ficus carica TaxID=3494 RepID=A0AA88AN53_FICCA|nr:hypothetical protein TIFTF001_023226 [Ficus carica]